MSPSRYLLDTSALLAHSRQEPAQRLPLADALIAAAARERGACLVHRHHHMAPIPGGLVEQIDLSTEVEPPL